MGRPACATESRLARLSLVQGSYFLATGLWPLLHIRSFEAVAGPKPEHWLVKTVGTLVAIIGSVLALAALRRAINPEIALLGSASAAGFVAVDVVYVLRRRVPPIFLADALLQAAFLSAWLLGWVRRSRAS